MTKEEMKEFLEGAKNYIETLKKFGVNTCPVCGMKVDSFEKVVEEIALSNKHK